MSSPVESPASFRTLLRRFRRSRRGSAALQFALVAPLFFALLFAIIEVSLMFFAGQYLETINQNLARLIMTGQAQQATYSSSSDFLNKNLCQSSTTPAPVLFTCSNLSMDVQCYPSWSSVSITSPVDAGGNFISTRFNPGGQGSIVLVRLSYMWPTFVTGLGFNLSNYGNKVLLTSTAAFKNEPYGSGSC
jgi:Flp pilus assembly protein TadG